MLVIITIICYLNFTEPTAGPVDISGIDAIDATRLFIFAVLFFGGVGLLMKGFV